MNRHISIQRKEEKDNYYARLQEQSIKSVQRLSGEIWTDYNEHDPGVTTLQALNYALLELDYRLQFDTQDYLTPPEYPFNPVGNTMFFPEEVFTVNPVTEMDYRKLFLSSVDNLVNVWPVLRPEEGIYDFILDVSSGTTENRREEIKNEVLTLYHTHRNLCENIGTIRFPEHKEVKVSAVIDVMNEHVNIEALIARLFIEIQEFLASGVRFRKLHELIGEGTTIDEIVDGPRQRRMVIDEQSLQQKGRDYNFLNLYHELQQLQGIHEILSLSLGIEGIELEKYIKSQPSGELLISYIVSLPGDEDNQTLILKKRGKTLTPDWELVRRLHHIMRLHLYGAQNDATDTEILTQAPNGIFRNIFNHYPVKNEFPSCYSKAKDLHRYLEIFDNQITDALNELKSFPAIMQLDEDSLSERKEQWLDMLDYMYGENSNLDFFKDPEAKRENRLRRNRFLKDIPEWGYARGQACNLLDFSENSVSGLEKYVKTIFFAERHELEIFILEHNLFHLQADSSSKVFIITAVLSAQENCMEDTEFTNNCEQVLLSRIPAHIKTVIYWLDKEKLREFRKDYSFWRYLLSTEAKTGVDELSEKMIEYLENINK